MMEPSQLFLVVLLGQAVLLVQLLPLTPLLIVGPVKQEQRVLPVALVLPEAMVHTHQTPQQLEQQVEEEPMVLLAPLEQVVPREL
jgi:hypothetical protein